MTEPAPTPLSDDGPLAGTLAGLVRGLAARYRLEGEVGRGGTASVFRARDRRTGAAVALKVLHPGAVAALGGERFLREVRIAAALDHPRIVGVLDSGTVGRTCWIAMPLVEGESLRDRLDREGALPVAAAVRIAREVAAALAHAHARGVVHRDIKPENILLAADGARVSDFGVARSLAFDDPGHATGGFALGTPHYMSPEQARAAPDLDGRSDVYALGCVLYEMLAGRPPYEAAGYLEVLLAHVQAPVPALRRVRADVPRPLDRLVASAMAKLPAQRPKGAEALGAALATLAERLPAGGGTVVPRWRSGPPRWQGAAAIAALVVGAGAAVAVRPVDEGAREPAVVVAPFRSGGAHAALRHLGDGVADLLAARLAGEAGLRIADRRAVEATLRRIARDPALPSGDELRAVAAEVGATRIVLGSVVGSAGRLVLEARLAATEAGAAPRARADGPLDSLSAVVERLALQLVALEAGEHEDRLGALAAASPDAVRPYLDGVRAYRQGLYARALAHFRAALYADSTFALAAMRLRLAAGGVGSGEVQRANAVLARLQARLGPRDAALATALLGPAYPATSSALEMVRAWERALQLHPEIPEAHYELGDQYFHFGAYVGARDADARAAALFRRAVELNPAYRLPHFHLAELAFRRGDTVGVRAATREFAVRDTTPDVWDFVRWRLAAHAGDAAELARLRAQVARVGTENLHRMAITGQLEAAGAAEAAFALAHWRARERDPGARWQGLLRQHEYWRNVGRPDRMRALTDTIAAMRPASRLALRLRLEDARFAGGDTAAAVRAAAALETALARPAATATEREEQAADACALGVWHAGHGARPRAERLLARLLAMDLPAAHPDSRAHHAWCQVALAAALDPAALPRLDSLLLAGPRPVELADGAVPRSFGWANLLAAELHEARGELAAAVAAARRRPWELAGAPFLAQALDVEARLAAVLGEPEAAARAERHLEALRRAAPGPTIPLAVGPRQP